MAKIREYDRLQALLRTPQFRDDILAIRKKRNWILKQNLKEKFSEKYNLHYEDVEFLLNHFAFHQEIKGLCALKDEPSEHGIKNMCNEVLETPSVHTLQKITADYHFEIARHDLSYGKYVAVLVDLSQNKRKIISDFEDYLDGMARTCTTDTNYLKELRGKGKDFQYPIWTVYDLCSQKRKPNFTEVARRLSGKSGQARDNAQLRASLEAVKRAYKKACEIMEEVKEMVHTCENIL